MISTTYTPYKCGPYGRLLFLMLRGTVGFQVLLKRNTKPPELPTSGTVRKVKAEDLAPKINKGWMSPIMAVKQASALLVF